MKKLLSVACALSFTLIASSAFALQFETINVRASATSGYTAGYEALIDAWMGTGNYAKTLENFESYPAASASDGSGWDQTLATSVGTFHAKGTEGTGNSAYSGTGGPKFSIQGNGPSWGRENVTPGGDQWLDSGDISKLILDDIDGSLTNLFFYMSDPSDMGATTKLKASTTSTDWVLGKTWDEQNNGSLWFVGVKMDLGESLQSLKWTTSNTDDGYGLDDFGTSAPAPVPEPATMLLFGTGLVGLAGVTRRRKAKK